LPKEFKDAFDISNLCSDLEQSQVRPPLGFVMVMSAQ